MRAGSATAGRRRRCRNRTHLPRHPRAAIPNPINPAIDPSAASDRLGAGLGPTGAFASAASWGPEVFGRPGRTLTVTRSTPPPGYVDAAVPATVVRAGSGFWAADGWLVVP